MNWKKDRLNLALLKSKDIQVPSWLSEEKFSTNIFLDSVWTKEKGLPISSAESLSGAAWFLPGLRLPIFHEQMSCLPVAKKRKISRSQQDKKLLAWLKGHPSFSFLAYSPQRKNKAPKAMAEQLAKKGIQPVIETDLSKMNRWTGVNKLPLLLMEGAWPDSLYEEPFRVLGLLDDLAELQQKPNFNPSIRTVVLQPEQMRVIAWQAQKGHLTSLSTHTAANSPFFGFRPVMTCTDYP